MATISENLQSLKTVKQDIRAELEKKGVDMMFVPFGSYASKISEISVGTNDKPTEGKSAIIVYAKNNLGEVIRNVTVTITGGGNTYTATSDNNGRVFQEVDAGTYTVSVGYKEMHVAPESQSVVAEVNETKYVYMTYTATTLTVIVKKDDGTPVVGAFVVAEIKESTSSIRHASGNTKDNGEVVFVLKPGTGTVRVTTTIDEYHTPEEQPVTVVGGQNTTVMMTYNRIKTALVIYAMDNGGGAIVGAEVTVTGDGNYSGVTDDTGLFYQEVPAGNYTISVNDQSGYTTPTSQSVSVVYGQELEVDMVYILESTPIYGVTWVNDASTSMTRTDDAVGMSYTISSGKVASDFDNVFPYNQMKRQVIDGNTFVYVPSMWFRVVVDSSKQITSVAVSATKGDGDNWYQTKPFYYGAYGASSDGTVLKSVSGASRQHTITRAEARTRAMATGTGYHQRDLYAGTVLMFLWWIEFATKNSGSVMTGCDYGQNTGETNTIYNEEEGNNFCVSGYNTSTKQMVWHGIEDYVGNYLEFEDGITGNNVKGGEQYVSDDYMLYDDYSDSSKMSALSFSLPTSGNKLEAVGWDSTKPFLCQPIASGSYSSWFSGFCDKVTTSNNIVAMRGSSYYSTDLNGVSAFFRDIGSYTSHTTGCRLMKEV
jgi:hypothetical protein